MKKIFPSTILQSILMLILLFLCFGLVVIIDHACFNYDRSLSTLYYSAVPGVFLGFYILHLINRNKEFAYDFKLNRINLLALSVIVVIAFQFGFYAPVSRVIFFTLYPDHPIVTPFTSIMAVVGPVLLAPFLEEIIFRNYILKGMLTTYSSQKAIIASALLFGLAHYYPHQLVGALPLGLFFGWIYYKTRSVGVTIVLHAVANLTALFTSYIHFKFGDNTITAFSDIYGDYSIYIIPLSVLLLVFALKSLFHKMNVVVIAEEL